MKAREVIQRLKADGWHELPGKRTSHKQFRHPTRPDKVTVAVHPGDIEPWVVKNIEKQSGVSMD
jgi:predicted RNA binding protein YcfA (HicA-like mRNA interferase family)